ncbi:hypothetical protein ACFYOY_13685 [Streptomyces sp. NPDC007875]|uniref:hypothetical protein n=1 Tax=Streptomyces sp. NPDC007875 TaxID=3364783 RepID=UPI00368F15BC
MTPFERAEARAAQSSDPVMFRAAFHAGRQAKPGEDSDGYVRQLTAQGETAALAGYLEGLASRRQHPVGVYLSTCDCMPCRVRRDERAYADWLRTCRKQVAA